MTEKQAMTRKEHKKLKLAEQQQAGPVRARRTPIWLRFVIFILLIFIFAVAGAMTGYSGLGGGRPIDVLKPSTWTHIYDLVEKK